PGYIDPDVDPALTGDQDPTIRKPLDPYANGDIVPGRTFGAPVGYAPTPADRAEQDRLVTPLDPYDPTAIAGRVESSADAYAKATPEDRARIDAREAAMFETRRQTEEMKALEADRQALEANIRARAAAKAKTDAEMAAIAADTKAMSDASPFESWWSDRSTGQKIANGIAAIFGGLLAPAGGRNSAIDLMLKVADDDAAAKWKKLAARRENVGDMQAAAQSDFIEAEKIRLVGREQVARQIQAQLATLNPEGSQAIALGKTLAGLQDQRMQAWAALGEKMQARNDAEAAQALEVAKYELDAAKAEDASKLAWARYRRAGQGSSKPSGVFGDKTVYTVAQWQQIDPKLAGALGHIDPSTKLTGKDVKDLLEITGKSGQQSIDSARQSSVEQATQQGKEQFEREREITFDGKPLYAYDASGKVILDAFGQPQRITAQTPDEGKEIRLQIANSARALELLYEAKAIRSRASAGDTALPWKKANQRLEAIGAEVIKKMKAGTQGMSSDSDMDKIAAGAGVKNLKSIIGQDAAIDEGIRIITDTLNSDVRQRFGYKGPPLTVPNPHAGDKPARDDRIERINERAPQPGFFSRDTWDPTRAFKDHDGVSARNRAGLNEAVAAIERGDADAPKVAVALADAAISGRETGWGSDASNPVKQAAAAELWRLRNAGNPAAVQAVDGLDRGRRAALISHLPAKEAKAAFAELFDDLAPKDQP
ncbi:MAG: hypothetical protein KBD62_36750, partial [Kofleriaceae bacterium]|nr:hypothetical protein [Kofleriaceae bacterium]